MCYQVAVVKWADHDEWSESIQEELASLGHQTIGFRNDQAIPNAVDVVFSFGPYGEFLRVPERLAAIPSEKRPTLVHWDTEALPDYRIPWSLLSGLCAFRSWTGRLSNSTRRWDRTCADNPPLSWANKRMHRFRMFGDYYYAYRKGWMDVLCEYSEIYARLHRKHGLPAVFVSWGTSTHWFADLNLERDIDVLYMGQRRTRQRSELIETIRDQLKAQGFRMYVADNLENKFLYGQARVEYLNRSKITLNLLTSPVDNNFPHRFHLAAGNRSLVVSESFLPHCSSYKPGTHYVSAQASQLGDVILSYLKDNEDRHRITDNAYELVTREMTLQNSVRKIMDCVREVRRSRYS